MLALITHFELFQKDLYCDYNLCFIFLRTCNLIVNFRRKWSSMRDVSLLYCHRSVTMRTIICVRIDVHIRYTPTVYSPFLQKSKIQPFLLRDYGHLRSYSCQVSKSCLSNLNETYKIISSSSIICN